MTTREVPEIKRNRTGYAAVTYCLFCDMNNCLGLAWASDVVEEPVATSASSVTNHVTAHCSL